MTVPLPPGGRLSGRFTDSQKAINYAVSGEQIVSRKLFVKVNLILPRSPSTAKGGPPPSRREAIGYEALKIICIPDKQALYH